MTPPRALHTHRSVLARLPRGVLALLALVSLAAVGVALVSQHVFGMNPCPWCILQRVTFLALAAVALLGWALPQRAAHRAAALAVAAIAIAGVAMVAYQHLVAARAESCALSLADRVLFATGLETLWPFVFQVTATCAEAAAARLLGLPYELWSGALFALLAVLALALFAALRRR